MVKKGVQRGRSEETTAGVPSGYVEDADEMRTQLGDFFSMLLGERVMTAVMLSRLKEFQEEGIHDIGPLPHGDVAGIRNEAESRSRDGAMEFFSHQRGKHGILLAPENQRRVSNLSHTFRKAVFPQGEIVHGGPKRCE